MTAPRLGVALELEAPERTADGRGGWRVTWRPLGRLWCAMSARSGRETTTRLGMVSVVQWRITTRGAPMGDPRRPMPGQRLRNGARVFVIEAVAEAGPHHLDCFAREEEQA